MNKTHRMLAAALALAVLLTLLPAATLAETVTGVTTTKCNFRTGPGQSYAQVAECKSIPKGASVTVLDNTTGGEYWKVAYKTYTGWIWRTSTQRFRLGLDLGFDFGRRFRRYHERFAQRRHPKRHFRRPDFRLDLGRHHG